ncbi:MAG: tail fiber domain-containing protein [Saccharofermentanales bacterium]
MSNKKYVADIIQVNNDSNGIKFVKEDGTTILFNINTENQTIQGVSALYNPTNINGDEVVYVGQDGKFYIQSDIIVSGETYIVHAEEIKTTKDLIVTRSESNSGILSGDISGIQVSKYNGTDDLLFGTDSDGYFKVGKIGSLQILSTRQDSPISSGITYWNNTDKRFDTHSNLTYNPTTSTLSVTNINATLSGTATSVSQSLTAGNGLTSSDTYDGSVARTFSVQSQTGTSGTIGTVNVTSNGIGVNLGTTSITAFRGDHGNTAYNHAVTTSGSVHGSTTVGINLFRLTNPSAIRFIRINDDNTVDALTDSQFRTAIGAGTSSTTGTVTSVANGNGMNFTSFTTSGTITLGTPSSVTLSSTNSVTTSSHTHNFAPGGTSSQYIRGDGTLATTPVNTNYYLTGVSGSGNGTVTFTVNGATNPTWDASHTHSYLSNSTSSTQTGSFGELYSRTRLRLYYSSYYFTFDAISSTDLRLRYNSTSSSVFRFLSNGTFEAASNIIGYSTSVSDSRLKENVNNLKSSLDKVLMLRGVNYEWIGENKDGTHVGYIAQEVEEIIPEVVVENDLMKFGGVYKTIRYEEIIPYLSEAIKEQQNTINELKEEIYNLKTNNMFLYNKK